MISVRKKVYADPDGSTWKFLRTKGPYHYIVIAGEPTFILTGATFRAIYNDIGARLEYEISWR